MTQRQRPIRGLQMRRPTGENADEAEKLPATRKVLVFDQETIDLARHSEPFEAHGFEVHKCTSVETAMRCIERENFDFALVDQGSSSFEGIRVIRHLVRYNLPTPFVVIARCKDALCHKKALALGAMDYLEKPVSSAQIDWIIERYLVSPLKQ
jgi:DNA-binding NtrC family response regulator